LLSCASGQVRKAVSYEIPHLIAPHGVLEHSLTETGLPPGVFNV
jgi:hypothetical protein